MRSLTNYFYSAACIFIVLFLCVAPGFSVDDEYMLFIVEDASPVIYATMQQLNVLLLSSLPEFAVAKIPVTQVEKLPSSGIEYQRATLLGGKDRVYLVINPETGQEFDPETMGTVIYRCGPYTVVIDDTDYTMLSLTIPVQIRELPETGISYPGSGPLSTPAPSPTFNPVIDAMVSDVSATEMAVHLNYFTVTLPTRYTYSPYCVDATDYVYNHFDSLGLTATRQYWNPAWPPNIVAEKTGLVRPDEHVILIAHVDSSVFAPADPMVNAPGAEDNASGAVAVLEAARVLSSRDYEGTIIFLVVTGEEIGLLGSHYYALQAVVNADDILAVINLDMVGWGGNDIPSPEDLEIITNGDSEWLADYFVQVSGLYPVVPAVKHTGVGLSSDHISFWDRGFTCVFGITEIGTGFGGDPFYPYYHTINDTIDKIDPDHHRRVTQGLLANAAHLAVPYAPTPTPSGTVSVTPTETPTSITTPTPTTSGTHGATETPTYTPTPTQTSTPAYIPATNLWFMYLLIIVAGFAVLYYSKTM